MVDDRREGSAEVMRWDMGGRRGGCLGMVG